MSRSTAALDDFRAQRDEARTAALALMESEDYDPNSDALKQLEERAASLDSQIERMIKIHEQQEAATALDSRLSSAARRTEQHRSGTQVETRESPGEAFVRSAIYQEYPGRGTSPRFELDNLLDTQHRAPLLSSNFGDISLATQRTVEGPALEPVIFDVISTIPVTGNSVEIVKYEFDDNTADVPEGQPKPESSLAVTVEPLALSVQAHWVQMARTLIEDQAAVRSRVDQDLRRGVLKKMAANALAALTGGTYQTADGGGDLLAGIRVGIGLLAGDGVDGGYSANCVVMNPADWAAIDTALLATTGNPAVGRNFWGITPVAHGGVAEGTAYVMDGRTALEHYRRTSAVVYISDSHASTFTSNVMTLLGEGRSATALVQPAAVVEVSAGTAP